MKDNRQNMILEIIGAEPIDTQELLQQRLSERGIVCTQATISRDIKQLHLVKEPTGGGNYRYAVSAQRSQLDAAEKLRTILRESVVSIQPAQNLVVVKTMPGLASAAGAALDGMCLAQIVGSLAGDDTALLVMRDAETATAFCDELRAMVRN